MADVKWIKIATDIFDDEKILLIESLPEADTIITIWFKLLCLAGKQNNSGVFLMNDKIAYTDKMLATIFRRKESSVQLALTTFQEFGMIEIIDNVITIPNWSKHQSLDQVESKREYMKAYMKEKREKQKALIEGEKTCKVNSKPNSKVNSKTNCKANVSSLDIYKEEVYKEDKEYIKDIKDCDTKNVANAPALPISQLNQVDNSSEKQRTYFKKPTVEEVEAYCKERKNAINPQAFVDFYEAKNWFIGKTKMKDWKACVRTWENRDSKGRPAKAPGKYEKELQGKDIMEGMDVL